MWSSIITQENNFVMPEVVVGAFFLECSISSIVFGRELQWSRSVWATHNTRHQADPTKYTIWIFFHEYSAWLLMLKHGQVIPMISSSLGYRNGFSSQWLYDAKNSFVYAWQAAFHMWKIGVQRFSASVHMKPKLVTVACCLGTLLWVTLEGNTVAWEVWTPTIEFV